MKKGSVKSSVPSLLLECLKWIAPCSVLAVVLVAVLCNISRTPDPQDPVSETAGRISSPHSYGTTVDDDILKVINQAKKIVYDYDGNGKINCVDRAVAFKLVWDQWFGEYSLYKCEIVKNYNKGVLNHLFVRVKYGVSPWIYVEPSYDPARNSSYEMWDVWGSAYNPLYNIYGETNKWLSHCKEATAAAQAANGRLWNVAAYGTATDVRAALKNGANVNARDEYDRTALMYAAWDNKKPSVAKALLAAGADVNARGGEPPWTVLMYAARYNTNPDVLKALLDGGADRNAWDNGGWRAIDYLRYREGKDEFYGTRSYKKMFRMLE